MRILLVEDHADTLFSLARMLVRRGHVVSTASTLADARRQCDTGAFDLLLCDIGLPDGDGWELGEVAARCGIKAVATTGYGMPDDIEKSKSAGFAAHVLKPFTFDTLEQAISSAVAPQPTS